jgi:hypothetical protein
MSRYSAIVRGAKGQSLGSIQKTLSSSGIAHDRDEPHAACPQVRIERDVRSLEAAGDRDRTAFQQI